MIPGVESFLEQYHMIEQSDVVVAGVSGGADSVCLLLHLLELKEKLSFTLAAVHVQHGIRGEESLQDAAFVEELCRRYQVQLFRYDYDVPEYAKQHGYSEEEAGRNLRYESFHKALEELGAPEGKIAVAHNRNDLGRDYALEYDPGQRHAWHGWNSAGERWHHPSASSYGKGGNRKLFKRKR